MVKFKPASRRLRMKDLQPGMVLNWDMARAYHGPSVDTEVVLEHHQNDRDLSFAVYVYVKHYRKKCREYKCRMWPSSYMLRELSIARGPW